jgi:hypothetical protein
VHNPPRWVCAAVFLLIVLAIVVGCGQQPPARTQPVVEASPEPASEPGEIELYDAKANLTRPDTVAFEVKYRFTKGWPDRLYRCDIFFPGTENHATRTMQSPEMKKEGIIRDTAFLRKQPVKTFEIYFSETTSPKGMPTQNSNKVTGTVQQ